MSAKPHQVLRNIFTLGICICKIIFDNSDENVNIIVFTSSLGSSGIKTGQKPKPISSGPKPVNLYGSGGEEQGGFIENAAGSVLGGGEGLFGGGSEGGLLGGDSGGGGIFGDGDGIFGDGGDDEGPFDGIGDALGDLLDGRSID